MFRPFLGLIAVVALPIGVPEGGAGVAAAEEPQVCHTTGAPAPKAVVDIGLSCVILGVSPWLY
jgi:hypothetical protein